MNAVATRPNPVRALRAIVVYTLRSALRPSVDRRARPAAASILFGLLATTLDDTADSAFVEVAATGALPPRAADHLSRHRRRGDGRGGPIGAPSRSPGCRRCPRGRSHWPLDRRHARRGRHRRPSRSRSPRSSPAHRRQRRRLPSRARSERGPTSRCSSPSGASPSAPRCGRSPSSSWSSSSSVRALTGIAQLCPGWVSREAFVGLTDVRDDLARSGMPRAPARSSASSSSPRSRSPSPTGDSAR